MNQPSIHINTRDLKPALTGLAKVIARNPTLPVLACVLIEPHPEREDTVTLTGTDIDTRLQLDLPAEVSAENTGPFLVPFPVLREAVKGARNGDTILLEPHGDARPTLTRESGSTRIPREVSTQPVSEFPAPVTIDTPPIDIDDGARSALLQALTCASPDPTRHVLQGALLEEGTTIIGTDGRHLYRSNSHELPLERNIILPCSKLFGWKPVRECSGWTLALDPEGGRFTMAGDGWAFTARLVDGTYPNWRQVLPADASFKGSITFDPEQLDLAATTILSLPGAKASNKPVGLRTSKAGSVTLLARSGDEAPMTEVPLTGATAGGPVVTVFLNRDYVIKALRFGLNHADIIDGMSPVRLREQQDAGIRRDMIVMPVRMAESATTTAAPRTRNRNHTQREPMKNNNTNNGNGSTRPGSSSDGGTEEICPLDAAATRIHTVKDLLRQAAAGLTEVAGALKQVKADQKSTEKEIRQVRNTLRSLQKVEL